MRVGSVREIKNNERRIGLSPDGVRNLVRAGHEVFLESHAGEASGFLDGDYLSAGGRIVSSAPAVWSSAELVVKVKEPQREEYPLIRPGQFLFTYFHFAASEPLLDTMLSSRASSIAYETVGDGTRHPLLAPMSRVAGRMSVLVGVQLLAAPSGGKGILLPGVPGVSPGHVVILGSGNVGINAGQMAKGLGARLSFLVHPSADKTTLREQFPGAAILESSPEAIDSVIPTADLVIGAVYVSGEKAPALVSRSTLKKMAPGSVVVDVAIDQGGCFETSRPTTHENPTFVVDGVIHYCVANMPGAFPRTSTLALTNATLPFVQELATKGKMAFLENPALGRGLTTWDGKLVSPLVAKTFNRPFEELGPLVSESPPRAQKNWVLDK